MSELRECPFCGGTDIRLYENDGGDYGKPSYSVDCINDDCGGGVELFPSEETAIAAWNTRADDALMDEMAAAIERFERVMRTNSMHFLHTPIVFDEACANLSTILTRYRERKAGK